MTISTTMTKLISVTAASSGITTAPSVLPPVLNSVDLPCAIIRPGSAQWNEHADGLYRQVRTYEITVYVKPVAQGKGIDEGVQACLAPMQALGRAFLDNPTLDHTVDIVRQPFADTGVRSDLDYAGTPYHGFQFELDITEKTS